MSAHDRRPLPGTPTTALIARQSNNRLGAVYSALYGFWMSRQAALNAAHSANQAANIRRDAYSVVLFDHTMVTCIDNDFTSSPDELLARVLPYRANGGTDYTSALSTTQGIMQSRWSNERSFPSLTF